MINNKTDFANMLRVDYRQHLCWENEGIIPQAETMFKDAVKLNKKVYEWYLE